MYSGAEPEPLVVSGSGVVVEVQVTSVHVSITPITAPVVVLGVAAPLGSALLGPLAAPSAAATGGAAGEGQVNELQEGEEGRP